MWDKIRKICMENGLNACARGYKRLKLHPTLIYSCHSFGRLYKLVLGHLSNDEKSYEKFAFVFAHDIKTFKGYIKLLGLHPSSFICPLMI